ncbi:MAG: 2-C-methyl-D-erythritol 4-phosphate cytidylyltransferase, partial [Planctomycetota bacterium]
PPNEIAPPRIGAVLVAAGRGQRMGSPRNKLLVELNGRPILERAAEAISRDPRILELIVVVRPEEREEVRSMLSGLAASVERLLLPEGGLERADSVRSGVEAASPDLDLLLVHDAARPFVSRALLARVIQAGLRHGAAIPAIPVVDTLKQVDDGWVSRTVDRAGIYCAQTPQAFCTRVLKDAVERARAEGIAHTDEASLMEQLGVPVHVVAGESTNIKLTRPEDLRFARSLLELVRSEEGDQGCLK